MNILRRLIEASPEEDPERKLAEAALLIRRAGLEHLVLDDEAFPVSPEEVLALAEAGDRLEAQRVVALRLELEQPGTIASVLDGGKAQRRAVMRRELARERELEGRASEEAARG